MIVNIIGLGYIGVPTMLALAAGGVKVTGTDTNLDKLQQLRNKELTFKEKGLQALFEKAYGNLSFHEKPIIADYYIVAVPTPFLEDTKKIDPIYVMQAVRDILTVCPKDAVIIVESTVSPGTIENLLYPIALENGKTIGEDVSFVHAPERIIPGNMIQELYHNSRVIGCENAEVGLRVKNLYLSFCEGKIEITSIKMAEMSKVIENTYRDVNIAFANEICKICNQCGLDVYELIQLANEHPRVNILKPGPGVGGHCISVDPWFLVGDFPETTKLIRSAREVNSAMPEYVVERLREIMALEGIGTFREIGFYGLSYKENVDDIRESPSLQLMEILAEQKVEGFKIYDPFVKNRVRKEQVFSMEELLRDSKLIVILVGHRLLLNDIDVLQGKIVFDTKHVLSGAKYGLS